MSEHRVAVVVMLLGVLASGCEDSTGVEIIIRAGATDSKWVELFVGEDKCPDDECSASWTTKNSISLTSPQAFTYPRASPLRAQVKDGVATFRILPEPGHEHKHVLAVGAVGFDGTELYQQSNVTGSYVIQTTFDATGPIRFDETLNRPDVTDAMNVNEALVAVDVWGQASSLPDSDAPTARCAAFASTARGADEAVVIVPEDDHDCDGLVNTTEAACFAQNPAPAAPTSPANNLCFDPDGDKCVVGADSCDSTTGAFTPCAPMEVGGRIVCLPEDVCTSHFACMDDLSTCVDNAFDTLDSTTTCTVAYGKMDAGGAGLEICHGGNGVTLALSVGAGVTCEPNPQIRARHDLGTADPSLDLDGTTGFTSQLSAAVTEGCRLTLTASGSAPAQFSIDHIVIQVALSNGNLLVAPISLMYAPSSNVCQPAQPGLTCEPWPDDASFEACATL